MLVPALPENQSCSGNKQPFIRTTIIVVA